jgi:hypothetical protein
MLILKVQDRPIDRLVKEPAKLQQNWDNTKFFIKETIKVLRDLGIEDDSLLPSRTALVPLVYYLYKKENKISVEERDRILLWFLLSSFFGRFSSQVDTRLDEDLEAIRKPNSLEKLFANLYKGSGKVNITIEDFQSHYKQKHLLLMIVAERHNGATDWFGGTLVSSKGVSRQHIFPRAFLRANGLKDHDLINDIANITLLSLQANKHMGKNPPEEYFRRNYVGKDKIDKHFVPIDPKLWSIDNYKNFLETRRTGLFNGVKAYLNGLGLDQVMQDLGIKK